MATIDYRKNDAFKKKLPRFYQYLVLSIVTLLIIVPLVIMVFGALKTRGEMFLHPYTLPIPPHWENFAQILSTPSFWSMLRNSLVVMLLSTAGVLIVCSLAAFVFARIEFRGKDLAFNLLTLGLMFPITVAIMPVYLVIRHGGFLSAAARSLAALLRSDYASRWLRGDSAPARRVRAR